MWTCEKPYIAFRAAAMGLGMFLLSEPSIADIRDPLSPENSVLLLVDLQPQYVFSVQSIDANTLLNNATGLAKTAKVFDVPTVFATINAKSFAGPLLEPVQAARPEITPLDRTSINAWDDERVREIVRRSGRTKILIAGLWTDSCVTLPALSALKEGYEVYVVTDVAGDVNRESHEMAIKRMIQAGAVPVTWLAVLLEWQKDWANTRTAGEVARIAQEHGGAWGQGIFYARTMKVGAQK
jgi:nicotinamidase-related amidase